MTKPNQPRTPMAGGFLMAVSVIAGALIGASQGQPSLGFVSGLGVGVVLLVAVWMVDKARGN